MNEMKDSNRELEKVQYDAHHYHVMGDSVVSQVVADSFESVKSCFGGVVNFFCTLTTSTEQENDQRVDEVNEAINAQVELLNQATNAIRSQSDELQAQAEYYKQQLLTKGLVPQEPDDTTTLSIQQQSMSGVISEELANVVCIPEYHCKGELTILHAEISERTIQLESLLNNYLEESALQISSFNDDRHHANENHKSLSSSIK